MYNISMNSRLKEQYKEIAPDVWVWNNFLSQEELAEIMADLESQDWNVENEHVRGLTSFAQYQQRILDSLNTPYASIRGLDNAQRRDVGAGMEPHVDIQNYLNVAYYNEVEESAETVPLHIARYGMIIYFNDNYDGGEICYVEDDFCYKPKAGDLVLHYAGKVHAVKKVRKGYRYTHSSYIADRFYVPEDIANSIDYPDKVDMSDPRLFYSVSHGPSLNINLEKIRQYYVYDGTY